MSSSIFLVEYLELFMYRIMTSAKSDSSTTAFPIWIAFIFLLTALANFQNYVEWKLVRSIWSDVFPY